jgi:hypothetical protein
MNIEKQIYWLFRCTEKKFASTFCSNGTIKLNTPRSWINYAREDGMGRGDLLEGVYCSYPTKGISSFAFLKEFRNNIESETDRDIIYLRSNDVIDLRSLCFYALYNTSFEYRYFHETGKWAKVSYVKLDYFRDFYKYKSREDIQQLPDGEQPVFVIIKSPNKFFERLYFYFEKIEIPRSDILIKPIECIDKKQLFIIKDPAPAELFIKDKRFINQSELRIVINSNNKKALECLKKDDFIIEIGDLSDITDVYPYYLEDMLIEYDNMTLKFNLPEPIIVPFNEMTAKELQSLLLDLKYGECRGWLDKDTIEESIKEICRLLREKYNLYHHFFYDSEGNIIEQF